MILDASALLALLQREPGQERIHAALLQGASISSVNYAEVVGKLARAGMADNLIKLSLDALPLEIVPCDSSTAFLTGSLLRQAQTAGLSLGDRTCLALSIREQRLALTTDKRWQGLVADANIEVIR